MKIKQTHEFDLEMHVERVRGGVLIVLDEIDSDGGQFHRAYDAEDFESMSLPEAREGGSVLAERRADEVHDWSDQEILERYLRGEV